MNKMIARMFALFLLLLALLAVPSHAEAKNQSVVLMPLIATGGLERDTVMSFENALIESLSTTYKVYYGRMVQDTVEKVFAQRSGETKAGKDCDDTKCLQDIAMAFQSELLAVCNVKKMPGGEGFLLSLKIQNVIEDTVPLSKTVPCDKCNEFDAIRALQGMIVTQAASPPAEEKPVRAQKEGGDKEVVLWGSIKDSSNEDDFEAYLQNYPDGAFTPLAKNRLAALQKAKQEAAEKAINEERAKRARDEETKRVKEEQAKREREEQAKRAMEEEARRERERQANRERDEQAREARREQLARDAVEARQREVEAKQRKEEEIKKTNQKVMLPSF